MAAVNERPLCVCVKYCGGCNPRWERTQVPRWLAREFPGVQLVVGAQTAMDNDAPPAVTAVVCGCPVCCAAVPPGAVVLSSPDDWPALRQKVREVIESTEESE